MQIRLRLEAVYRPELRDHFPKLSRALEEMGIKIDPGRSTLYHIVEELERGLYSPVSPVLKDTVKAHMDRLLALRKAIEERLAAWKLEGLDELLYKLEDSFEDLEKDLP